jgi:hypothetical protein
MSERIPYAEQPKGALCNCQRSFLCEISAVAKGWALTTTTRS